MSPTPMFLINPAVLKGACMLALGGCLGVVECQSVTAASTWCGATLLTRSPRRLATLRRRSCRRSPWYTCCGLIDSTASHDVTQGCGTELLLLLQVALKSSLKPVAGSRCAAAVGAPLVFVYFWVPRQHTGPNSLSKSSWQAAWRTLGWLQALPPAVIGSQCPLLHPSDWQCE